MVEISALVVKSISRALWDPPSLELRPNVAFGEDGIERLFGVTGVRLGRNVLSNRVPPPRVSCSYRAILTFWLLERSIASKSMLFLGRGIAGIDFEDLSMAFFLEFGDGCQLCSRFNGDRTPPCVGTVCKTFNCRSNSNCSKSLASSASVNFKDRDAIYTVGANGCVLIYKHYAYIVYK